MYAFIFTSEKSLYRQKNSVELFSPVEVWPIIDSLKAFPSQLKSWTCCIQRAKQIWQFLLTAPPSTFLEEMERGKGNYRYFLHAWLLSRKVFMASGKQLHIKQITERSLIVERLLSFKEKAMRKREHWCKRFQHVNLHLFQISLSCFI